MTAHADALARILTILRGQEKNAAGKNLSKNERLALAEAVAAEALGE
jgi:hypothetical protein